MMDVWELLPQARRQRAGPRDDGQRRERQPCQRGRTNSSISRARRRRGRDHGAVTARGSWRARAEAQRRSEDRSVAWYRDLQEVARYDRRRRRTAERRKLMTPSNGARSRVLAGLLVLNVLAHFSPVAAGSDRRVQCFQQIPQSISLELRGMSRAQRRDLGWCSTSSCPGGGRHEFPN